MTSFDNVVQKFNDYLDYFNVAYHCKHFRDGYQWKFDYWSGDVIITSGSYNHENGFVESYGFPWDKGDVSVCTPYEMARRLAGYEPRHDTSVEYSYDLYDLFTSLGTLLEDEV